MLPSLLILRHCLDQSSTTLLEDFKNDDNENKGSPEILSRHDSLDN